MAQNADAAVRVVNFADLTLPAPPAPEGAATEATLAAVLAAVDGLELTADQISVDAGTINLSTDQLEVLLAAVRDRLPSALDGDGGVKVHLVNTGEAGLTDAQLRATPVPVAGTVTANLGTIDGAATETTLAALLGELGQKYEGGPIALESATLAALETISVANMIPAVETGLTKEATLTSLLAEFRNKYDVVQTAKATYTSSGDHTLITPPPSQSLRVVWVFAQAKAALDTGVVLVTVTLGPNSYEFELTGSQPFAHGAVWEGGVDQGLTVNTSSAAAVLVNVDYRVW